MRAAPAAAPRTTNELLRIAYRFEDTSAPTRQYSTGPDEIAAAVPDCSPIFDDRQGGGLEAITKSKLHQMRYAANLWVEESKWRGEYTISAVEISGPTFAVMSFIEDAM